MKAAFYRGRASGRNRIALSTATEHDALGHPHARLGRKRSISVPTR
jgi:hypothetical protein